MHSVEQKFPDIGKSIEDFVSECNVGADAWRRTGVLTFDGNLRVKEKVTYGRIQEHLQQKYSISFHMAQWCNSVLPTTSAGNQQQIIKELPMSPQDEHAKDLS